MGRNRLLRGWDVYSFGYGTTALFPGIRGLWRTAAPLQTLADLFRTAMRYSPLARYQALAVQQGTFQAAIRNLYPHRDHWDVEGLVQLALALESVGRSAEAVTILEQFGHRKGTDAMGVLAGRLKRRRLNERSQTDAHRAVRLYFDALKLAREQEDLSQCDYHAINVAFMRLACLKNSEGAKKVCAAGVEILSASAERRAVATGDRGGSQLASEEHGAGAQKLRARDSYVAAKSRALHVPASGKGSPTS